MKKKTWIILVVIIALSWWGYSKFYGGYDYPSVYNEKPAYGSGEVVILEYSDIQCPFCARAHPVIKNLVEEYEGQVRWEWKHFPLTQIHGNALIAAEGSECANDQEMFWEFIDEAFRQQSDLSKGNLVRIATTLGMDGAKFKACLYSRAKRSIVMEELAEANQLRLSGTPSFFLNGKPVASWQYESLKADIERELSES